MLVNNKWLESFNKLENKKVLLMLSGGKDSSACLHMLAKANTNVEAIHFKHKWGYNISTNEARKLCSELNVKLHEVDFSNEFLAAVEGYECGRTCLLCKPEMYKLVIKKIQEENFGCVCIGDNADDRMTIVRLLEHIEHKNEVSIYCNTYFGSERGIVLPEGTSVLRPVLDMKSTEIEDYLKSNGININKNNSTGDKYFEYSREGCPVQFYDPGYKIDEQGMKELRKYNILLSEYAKKHKIRASIHLPSTFIITIPEGYEEDALKYLETEGLNVNWDINKVSKAENFTGCVSIRKIDNNILGEEIFKKLNLRFMERLELKVDSYRSFEIDDNISILVYGKGFRFEFKYLKEFTQLVINFICKEEIEKQKIENLIVEVYRSRNYNVLI